MRELQHINIIPNGLRYWVLPDKKPETTIKVGEITITGNDDTNKEPPLQGRVVAVGDGEGDYGLPACKYKFGELVIFGKYAGTPHQWEDVDYVILHEDEILGCVPEDRLE